MSWREFSLRSYAFRRQSIEKWKHTREISYYSLIGSHMNPKRLPKSIEQFMPMEGDRKRVGVSQAHKEAFLKAFKDYKDKQLEALKNKKDE